MLTFDVVTHGESGPGSAWALHAQTGDAVGIRATTSTWRRKAGIQLLVADSTSAPAMRGMLLLLPRQGTPGTRLPGYARDSRSVHRRGVGGHPRADSGAEPRPAEAWARFVPIGTGLLQRALRSRRRRSGGRSRRIEARREACARLRLAVWRGIARQRDTQSRQRMGSSPNGRLVLGLLPEAIVVAIDIESGSAWRPRFALRDNAVQDEVPWDRFAFFREKMLLNDRRNGKCGRWVR